MTTIYHLDKSHYIDEREVLEDLRKQIAQTMGVTLNGNRLTVRWYKDNELVNVHLIIERVTTPSESQEYREQNQRMNTLYQKYPELEHELEWATTGEYSK